MKGINFGKKKHKFNWPLGNIDTIMAPLLNTVAMLFTKQKLISPEYRLSNEVACFLIAEKAVAQEAVNCGRSKLKV